MPKRRNINSKEEYVGPGSELGVGEVRKLETFSGMSHLQREMRKSRSIMSNAASPLNPKLYYLVFY